MIKVYHLDDETSFQAHRLSGAEVLSLFKAGRYQLVAEVVGTNLELAWQLTNSIVAPWWENEGVVPHRTKVRSSSVGDVFETSDGVRHVVAMCGFVRLPGSGEPR